MDSAEWRGVLGVEIADAGTRLALVASPGPGARRWRSQVTTAPLPDELITRIASLVTDVVRDTGRPVSQLGVAVWGDVEYRAGTVARLPPLAVWNDFPLASRLRDVLGVPVIVDTATNAAALAECTLGSGQTYSPALYVHVGRSVTGAVVDSGRVAHGSFGLAGHLGHWIVGTNGPRCSCGAVGHLDPVASAQAIVRNVIGRASGSEESHAAMLRIANGRAEAMTVAQVVRLARDGDPAARSVLDEALDALAIALADLTALLDPAIIILGGAASLAGQDFVEPVAHRLKQLMSGWRTSPPVVAGRLEPGAVLSGAYLLARAGT